MDPGEQLLSEHFFYWLIVFSKNDQETSDSGIFEILKPIIMHFLVFLSCFIFIKVFYQISALDSGLEAPKIK